MDKQPNYIGLTSLTLTLIAAVLAYFTFAFNKTRNSKRSVINTEYRGKTTSSLFNNVEVKFNANIPSQPAIRNF